MISVAALAAGAVVHAAIHTQPLRASFDCSIALAAAGATLRWVRANSVALDMLDWCDCANQTIRARVIAARPADRAEGTAAVESPGRCPAGVTLDV